MSLQYEITKAALGGSQYTNDTARVIKTGCKHFAEYCKGQGLNKKEKIQEERPMQVIQDYTDYLVCRGYSPSTIHSYIFGPCRAFNVNMGEIQKPKRSSNSISRSRDEKANPLGKLEAGKPEYSRLVEFQSRVGIRRAELSRLTGGDLTRDESGHLCVRVVAGKGGKDQLQLVLPMDENYIKGMFEGVKKDQYLFTSTELKNHIDLHGIRAEHARKAYDYYAGLSPYDKRVLREELSVRWLASHPDKDSNSPEYRKWYSQMTKGGGIYRLRGDNYDRAIRNGRPTSYDRVALMATSVFHLSHWRLGVTVTNYLL